MPKRVGLSAEIPELSIVFFASGGFPVTVEVQADWRNTGEYSIFCQDAERGRWASDVLHFAWNALADTIYELEREDFRRKLQDDEEAPF